MKISCIALFAGLVLMTAIFGQADFDKGFDRPWVNTKRALVLDGRYYNEINWEKLKDDRRIAGMIFRSTGPNWNKVKKKWEMVADGKKYEDLRKAAKDRGYLWGSFHVGMSDTIQPAKEQAQFYLDNINPGNDEVMALDLEDFSKHRYMKLEGAREFIQYIFDRTGRYPLVYVTGSVYDLIVNHERNNKNSVFAKTQLWYVRRDANIEKYFKNAPKDWWTTYTLWQFASELNCCRKVGGKRDCKPPRPTSCPFEKGAGVNWVPKVPGVEWDMDIDIYNGTVEELRKKWPFTFKEK